MDVNVGDWIYYSGNQYPELIGSLGYVLGVGTHTFFIKVIKDERGKSVDKGFSCVKSEIAMAAIDVPFNRNMFDALMDLALATKDFGWCRELLERFEGVKC